MAKIKESELKTVLVELPTDMQIAFNKDATNPTMSLVIDLLNAIKMQTIANKAVELLGGITKPKPYVTIEELEEILSVECMIEIDKKYSKIANKRIKKAQEKTGFGLFV